MMKRLFVLIMAATLLISCHDKNTYKEQDTAVQTLLMYFPWSGDGQDLTDHFHTNIEDMKTVVAAGLPEGCRVLVFFMTSGTKGELYELVRKGNQVEREVYCTYDYPAITTVDGIATIFRDMKRFAPAPRYAMSIGCHGMAWMPATNAIGRGEAGREAELEYWQGNGPLTRWFGGTSEEYRTEIKTLAEAIRGEGIVFDYILFDDCYMASVEVAYELRDVAHHLIGSTSEIMGVGFPYADMGRCMVGEVDYMGICEAFYSFYMSYIYPYGTISVTITKELEGLATVMKRINAVSAPLSAAERDEIQVLDGYTYTRFFDMGDYVRRYCKDAALLAEFEAQFEKVVPSLYRRHTPMFYSGTNGTTKINTFSGITTSDPSVSKEVLAAIETTSWWQATH